tara:strand:- start:81 stop:218 length:138 start_codon:yes stop_codon:yes gene_type:complete
MPLFLLAPQIIKRVRKRIAKKKGVEYRPIIKVIKDIRERKLTKNK